MGYSRRAFIRRAGVTAVTTGLVAVALPSPPPEQPSRRPVSPHDGEIPEITDERESPWALWQYSRERGGFEATSPINVAVALGGTDTSLDDVVSVFGAAGWVNHPAEYVRYAYNAQTDQYDRQNVGLAQTFHGGFGRHHVRVWDIGGFVSIQAHEDTPARPGHEIASYETTRHLIEWLFHDAGWTVKPDGAWFDNATDPDHAGWVTVIEP